MYILKLFESVSNDQDSLTIVWTIFSRYQKEQAYDMVQKVNHQLGHEEKLRRPSRRLGNLWPAIPLFRRENANEDHEESSMADLASQHSSIRKKWTLRHGFYALMGGYAIKTDQIQESDRFLPESEKRQFFLNLMKFHEPNVDSDDSKKAFAGRLFNELPELSEDDIWEKSKADGAAKTLTCIQTLWFIAQCITRLAMHIPISLLELNTLGHTVCALIIYVIWWRKPYNIQIATAVHSHAANLLLATWYFYTEESPLIQVRAKW